MIPGEFAVAKGELELNKGRKTVTVSVTNSGDRPVQVGSHYHFFVGRELREHRAHLLPGTAVGGEQRDLDARMAQQQSHELRAGIAGSAEHADLGFSRHGLQSLSLVLQDRRTRATTAGDIREKRRGTLVRRHAKIRRAPVRKYGGGGARPSS